jgi:hypothetical protein
MFATVTPLGPRFTILITRSQQFIRARGDRAVRLKVRAAIALATVTLGTAGCAYPTVPDEGSTPEPTSVVYPTKTIHLLAPAAAGGGWDATARTVQRTLLEAGLLNGQSIDVRNVAGAGGTVGLTELVNDHPRDPYQLMVMGMVMIGGCGVPLQRCGCDQGRCRPGGRRRRYANLDRRLGSRSHVIDTPE